MTDLEFILKTPVEKLLKSKLTTGTKLRKSYPKLTRDKRLHSMGPVINENDLVCDIWITVLFHGIPVTLVSDNENMKYTYNSLPIFVFNSPHQRSQISYYVDYPVSGNRSFKKVLNYLEDVRDELIADLIVVSDYFCEVNFKEIYRKFMGGSFLPSSSKIFKDMVDTFHRQIKKSDNFEDLLQEYYDKIRISTWNEF